MRRLLSGLISWLKRCFGKVFGRQSVFAVARAEEVDKERLSSAVLYVECRGGKDRWLHLLCPCGCGDVISLNLMTSHRPFWSLASHEDGTVSVMPSVDKTSGCCSHFFIRRCRIAWAGARVTS